MDFDLTDEQRAFQQAVSDFAADRVAPRAARIDETGEFPRDLVAGSAALGLMGVTVPPQWGGAGRDYVSYALAIEAVARASAVVAVIAAVNNSLVAEPIAEFGSDGAERNLAAAARSGRGDRRVRALRGARRLRRREPADGRRAGRRRLRHQRAQGLGRQRRGRGRRDRVCRDEAGERGRGITAFLVPMDRRRA